jgi:hypothetical protein
MSTAFLRFKINAFYSFFAAPLLSLFLLPAMAQADSVGTPSLSDLPSSLDLNDFAAWAYYADVPAGTFGPVSPTTPTTDLDNLASFSVLTSTNSSFQNDPFAYTPVTFTGAAAGGYNGTSATNSTNFDFAIGNLSMSSKLIATTETLHFYLYDYDGAANISLTLGNDQPTTLYTNTVLPQILNGNSYGSGDNVGELSVTVQGSIGETLSFTLSPNNTSVEGSGHTGLQAVTIDEIPEPAAWAMMLAGLAFLGFRMRARSNFRS